jgi:autoinducer 2-degrading protein
MICVAVTYVIQPGREEEAIAHFHALIPATRAEPGCRMYLVHRSPSKPGQFFLYEQYDDQAALDAHRAAPYFVEHVRNGLFTILETRTPEVYELLEV